MKKHHLFYYVCLVLLFISVIINIQYYAKNIVLETIIENELEMDLDEIHEVVNDTIKSIQGYKK